MTIEEKSGTTTPPPGTDNAAAQSAAAAAAAQAALAAAKPIADPAHRAEAGWDIASKSAPAGAGPAAAAVGDAGANARTAMSRTDLPPAEAANVRTVVERLGNAVVDGKIEPHINNTFREHLYALATEPADSPAFKGAQAQLTRAADVLSRTELASGSRLAYDAGANQPTGRSGLPILNVDKIDADLYFKTADGTLHIEGAKLTPNTLATELKESQARGPEPSQLQRQLAWQSQGTADAPHSLGMYVHQDGPRFDTLLSRMGQLEQVAGGNADARRFAIGDRNYSVNDLKAVVADGVAAAGPHVEALREQHIASGQPPETFKTGAAYGEFYKQTADSAALARSSYGGEYGEPRPALSRLPQPEAPSLRQGAAFGAVAAGGITLLRTGDAGEAAKQTLVGAGVGTAQAAGERVVTPIIDRAVGQTVQRVTTSAVTSVSSTATAESAAVMGAGARTLATRIGGSTVVGAVIATGISAYENRDGLAKGDSHAIGNVAADATVAAGSIAAATATGAAIGSIVPVAGTAVGAVVGLAVGVGIAYGAQISGVRDAIADGASNAVDWVKSWF